MRATVVISAIVVPYVVAKFLPQTLSDAGSQVTEVIAEDSLSRVGTGRLSSLIDHDHGESTNFANVDNAHTDNGTVPNANCGMTCKGLQCEVNGIQGAEYCSYSCNNATVWCDSQCAGTGCHGFDDTGPSPVPSPPPPAPEPKAHLPPWVIPVVVAAAVTVAGAVVAYFMSRKNERQEKARAMLQTGMDQLGASVPTKSVGVACVQTGASLGAQQSSLCNQIMVVIKADADDGGIADFHRPFMTSETLRDVAHAWATCNGVPDVVVGLESADGTQLNLDAKLGWIGSGEIIVHAVPLDSFFAHDAEKATFKTTSLRPCVVQDGDQVLAN